MSLIALPTGAHTAATNMAIDAALLESVPEGSALFRHYGWSEPAITFGYTQRIREIKAITPATVRLCRRLTGGGIVDHRNDWTYALALHSRLTAANVPATELYANIHRCLQQALADQSVTTCLAPCPRACGQTPPAPPSGPSRCFIQPVANDVLHTDGRKIAGAAMKRTRRGLLIQGSIGRSALPETLSYEDLCNALLKLFAALLTLNLSKASKLFPERQTIQKECQRFESDVWTNRR